MEAVGRIQTGTKTRPSLVEVENSRNGATTLAVNVSERRVYLHSKYDPHREAEMILEEYKNFEDNSTVIFYGTDLATISLLLPKTPKC